MLKIFLTIIIFSLLIESHGQNVIVHKNNLFIGKIISTYETIGDLYDQFEDKHSGDLVDSIFSYNDRLYNLILSTNPNEMTYRDWKKVQDSTDIKIVISQDKKLLIISWSVLYDLPNPSCSNIAILNKHKPQIISRHGSNEEKLGDNIQID